MVENHIEDDGDSRRVQSVDSRAHLRPAARREARIGGEHRDGVVPPIVAEPERRQMPLVDPRRKRHELDGGHTQSSQIFDRSFMRQSRKGAANCVRYVEVPRGEAAHMHFVNDEVSPFDAGARGQPNISFASTMAFGTKGALSISSLAAP